MPGEPSTPQVVTQVPGPRSISTKERLDPVFDARAVQLVVDYEKSQGN